MRDVDIAATAPPATAEEFSRKSQFDRVTSDESLAFSAPPVDPSARFRSKVDSRSGKRILEPRSEMPPPSWPLLSRNRHSRMAAVEDSITRPLPRLFRNLRPRIIICWHDQRASAPSQFPSKLQSSNENMVSRAQRTPPPELALPPRIPKPIKAPPRTPSTSRTRVVPPPSRIVLSGPPSPTRPTGFRIVNGPLD